MPLPLPKFKSYERDKKTLAFEKGICGCDEKRDSSMETAHAGRQSNKSEMLLPADNIAEEGKNCKSDSNQHDVNLPKGRRFKILECRKRLKDTLSWCKRKERCSKQ